MTYHHTRLAGIGVALAGAALSGCSFTTGSTTTTVEVGPTPAGAVSQSQQGAQQQRNGTGSDTGVAGAGARTTPLCDRLKKVYLGKLSDHANAAALLQEWDQAIAAAPTKLQPDLRVVGAYMTAAARGDMATVKGAYRQVQSALDHVDRYVDQTCKL